MNWENLDAQTFMGILALGFLLGFAVGYVVDGNRKPAKYK